MESSLVVVTTVSGKRYPQEPPFHPSQRYPELILDEIAPNDKNYAYDGVRSALHALHLDEGRFEKSDWNPLGCLISPGDTVFLKPNFIAEGSLYDRSRWDFVITHGAVTRAVIDYVFKALQGHGRIIVGDGPQTDSDFHLILERTGLRQIQEFYKRRLRFDLDILDLRNERWINRKGIHRETTKLGGDPRGNVQFNLDGTSAFGEVDAQSRKYYGAFYDTEETNFHHRDGVHQYLVSRSAIESDVFINIPKLKTHKKVGLTVNLKGLVGINGNKNWLPHYTFGSPENHGDQFLKRSVQSSLENSIVTRIKRSLVKRNRVTGFLAENLKQPAYRLFGSTDKVVRSGNWYGNDTCWRMCLDLNAILLHGSSDGSLDIGMRKKFFSLVDGIIAMEGDGPVSGTPRMTGLIIAGFDPLNVDMVCARLMGFDYSKIKLLERAYTLPQLLVWQDAPEQIRVISNLDKFNKRLFEIEKHDTLHFAPHHGWAGYIEL